MTASKASRALRQLIQATNVVVLTLLLVVLAACDFMPKSGPLAEGETWQATCPQASLASYAAIDISATFAAETLDSANRAAIRDLAARTAVCGGRMRVTAFWGSSAGTAELYDGALSLPGATDNARYRRIGDVTDEVLESVAATYEAVVAEGPHLGSDIIGQLRLASEFAGQVGHDAHLAVLLLTDGLQTVAVKETKVKTVEESQAFADQLPVPELTGELLVAGLGNRADGTQVASATVELLKVFYGRICERTGAQPCRAVTDYSSPVGSGS